MKTEIRGIPVKAIAEYLRNEHELPVDETSRRSEHQMALQLGAKALLGYVDALRAIESLRRVAF